jgi:dihydroorotate dehydrogenase (fumarate)
LSLSSLFEEQVRDSHAYIASLVDGPAESFAEAVDYVPESVKRDFGAQAYLRLIERGAATLDIPAIASLNGVSAGGWTSYARAMQDAGAVAIELNIWPARNSGGWPSSAECSPHPQTATRSPTSAPAT